jgi:hypothetical protein
MVGSAFELWSSGRPAPLKRHHSPATKTAHLRRVSDNPAAGMIVQRLCPVLIVLCLGSFLGSCGSVSSFTSDHWPHWAGGEPNGVPPRPGEPGYDEYIAHQQSNPPPAKPTAANVPPAAQAAPPAAAAQPAPAEDDAAAARGGLY